MGEASTCRAPRSAGRALFASNHRTSRQDRAALVCSINATMPETIGADAEVLAGKAL